MTLLLSRAFKHKAPLIRGVRTVKLILYANITPYYLERISNREVKFPLMRHDTLLALSLPVPLTRRYQKARAAMSIISLK